mmetsp:Transcript_49329/g.117090  ORF Transcript_49329/g.117090 Transcript_49329/m.117090 type:complete len:556 (-) Transcript_49329:233-1900(-)
MADQSKCTVGPVIGRVTTTTARVLVESPVQAIQIIVSLSSGGSVVKEVSKSRTPALRPLLFAFDGLSAGTKYTLSVKVDGKTLQNCDPTSPATFKTMSETGQCRVGVVSCNKIYVSQNSKGEDAWGLLKHRVLAGDLDCLLHVGDQVYADHEYGDFEDGNPTKVDEKKFLEKLKHEGGECIFLNAKLYLESLGGYDQWSSGEETVREMFRKLYRQTWSYPATAAVLANVPNSMLPDDHEFRDDWGDREEDYDRRGIAWFIARCGYRVFREYQAALNGGDGDKTQESSHQFFPEHLVFPDFLPQQKVGLLSLDTRCKAFLQPSYPYAEKSSNKLYPDANDSSGEASPFLGQAQWDDVTAALKDGGALSSAMHLILATSCPPTFLGEKGTKFIVDYLGGNDFYGSWAHPRNMPELLRLLGLLKEWKARKPGRQVVIVGGDVHSGAISEISQSKSPLFTQLTASPVSNKTLTPAMAGAQKFLQKITEDDFPSGYSVSHKSYEWRCNFGTVTFADGATGAPALALHGAGDEKPLIAVTEEIGGQTASCLSTCAYFCSVM